jgi:hypothetical protein
MLLLLGIHDGQAGLETRIISRTHDQIPIDSQQHPKQTYPHPIPSKRIPIFVENITE